MGFDVKNTTFFSLLDVVFPYTCRGCGRLGSVLCERCKKHNIQASVGVCPRCKKSVKKCCCEVPVYGFCYREGLIDDLLKEYKYKSVRGAAEALAECLDVAIPDEVLEAEIVPLPTAPKHIRARGFDHTLYLAKALAKRREGFSVCRALKRTSNDVQVGKDDKVRLKQAERAYEADVGCRVDPEKLYILIDDVWTTGASVEAATKVMKKAGATRLASAVILMPR